MKKLAFEGKVLKARTNEELKSILNKYNVTLDAEWLYKKCVDFRESCIYKTYYIELAMDNKNIYWIGLDEEGDSFGSVTLYKNEELRRSILHDVMTFAEASEKWGLGESTLRSAIHSERFTEGIDYKKSGKVWLVTKEAMERVYGKIKEDL